MVYLYVHLGVLSMLLDRRVGLERLPRRRDGKGFLAFDVVLLSGLLFHALNGIRVALVGSGFAVDTPARPAWAAVAVGTPSCSTARSTSSELSDGRRRDARGAPRVYRRRRRRASGAGRSGTGVALVVLAAVHMVAQHFVVDETGGLRTYQQVLDYLEQPRDLRRSSAASWSP